MLAAASLVLALSIGGAPEPTVVYDLSVRLDPDLKTLTATGSVVFTNTSTASVRELRWHLYLNAFANNRSTFMRESGGKVRKEVFQPPHWGWIDVDTMTLDDGTDLLVSRRFEQPDDGNTDDRTVMKTELPRELAPGAAVKVSMSFHAKLPRAFARSGWAGDFIMVGQWFPKLGVLGRDGAWNCHQYHAQGEFFADFGDYRVTITVPKRFEVGATGRRVASTEHGDEVTHRYEQDRVHDFAWVADPNFLRDVRKFEDPQLPPVAVTMLLQPEHAGYADRYFRALAAALRWHGRWYGEYPYPTLTMVDGPRQAGAAMGMEYPTLITTGVGWPAPEEVAAPESVTIHEFAHQYWYGLAASNETEESWLDEGITTYTTGKVLQKEYGDFVYSPSLWGFPLTAWFAGQRFDYFHALELGMLAGPAKDAVVRPAWDYRSPGSYLINSYYRPALLMRQLELELGEEQVTQALRDYQAKYRFRHPTSEDFVASFEASARQPLRATFDRVLHEPGELDYAITELKSEREKVRAGRFGNSVLTDDYFLEMNEAEPESARKFRSTVYVERAGEVVHPMTLELELEDGTKERRTWDGVYRWARFDFVTETPARAARIYPDRDQVFDVDAANDSRTTDKNYRPALTWAAHFLYAAQTVLHIAGGWW